jgi:uncharacterized protein (TIGR02145 family)
MKRINPIILIVFVLVLIINSCKKKDDTIAKTTTTTGCASAPTVSYNGPVGIGDTIKFKAASVSGATYSWKGPKGFTSSLQNPSFVFAKGYEGEYTVTATAGGCTSDAYHVYVTNCEIRAKFDTTSILTVPPPPAKQYRTYYVNLYASSILTATSSAVDAIYTWTGPNGFTSTLQNIVFSNPTSVVVGTYTVTATTSRGYKSQPATVTVSMTPPAPTIITNSPQVIGGTLTLTAQSIAGATYNWTGPNGFTDTARITSIPNVTRANDGIYSVTYTVGGNTSRPGRATAVINFSNAGCGGQVTVTHNGFTYYTTQVSGTQCWLRSNIKNATDSLFTWTEATTGGVPMQGVCPTGWHIPNDSVWQSLAGLVANNGNALKSIGQGSGFGAGTNTSGFSALLNIGATAYKTAVFWSVTDYSSSDARYMKLYPDNATIYMGADLKTVKYPVRCIKD